MTVYVDHVRIPFRRMLMNHLLSDESHEELHVIAAKIGLRRSWFQGDHYDVSETKRAEAIRAGAVPIEVDQLPDILRRMAERGLRARGRDHRAATP